MPPWSKADWWEQFPVSTTLQRLWERKYLDVIGSIPQGSIADGVGLTNVRWLAGTDKFSNFKYDPLNYHSYLYFSNNPFTGEGQEVDLESYLETGLTFYVYIIVNNLYVNLQKIRENDSFFLTVPGTCEIGENSRIECTIIDPEELEWYQKKHQPIYYWGGTQFPLLALPVFLRIERDDLLNIQRIFRNNRFTTITYELRYGYPKEKRNELIDDGAYIAVLDTQDFIFRRKSAFITFGRSRRYINFLVATDLHVAERNDIINDHAEDWGIELPPRGDFCNYNTQSERLADRAYKLWKNGMIDYVMLTGDLIDFALKDSKVENQVNFRPTANFIDEPRPYGMGENAFNLSNALSEDSGSWKAFLTVHEWFPGRPLQIILPPLQEIIDKMKKWENTNWEVFYNKLKKMLDCVPTFLVPGNHDYMVFGSELTGIEPRDFNTFVRRLEELAEIEGVGWGPLAFCASGRAAIIGLLIFLGIIVDPARPGYQSLATYPDMGITEEQADKYDNIRTLTCGDSNEYRTFLAAFWDYTALNEINSITRFAPSVHICTGSSSYRIETNSGWLRLIFLDSGPNWNQLVNPSPWLWGFPSPQKGPNEILRQLEQWRYDEDNMLVLFMHSPPLNRRYPQTGPPQEFCFQFINHPIEYHEDHNKWPALPCEQSNNWMTRYMRRHDMNLSEDPSFGSIVYNNRRLLCALSPKDYFCFPPTDDGSNPECCDPTAEYMQYCPYTPIFRNQPVLTMAGHTHWKHTYSIKHTHTNPGSDNYTPTGCVKFLQGNDLLKELNESNDVFNWWRGRSLIVTSGCIGPKPPGEYKMGENGKLRRLEYGDEGYTPPDKLQGYYIVRVDKELGVVDKMDWHEMYYKTEDLIWECQNCHYKYDDFLEGILFEDLPEDWSCPSCGAGKDTFETK